jgi:(p)ppGpp synthase/HD superfamily hydrolase
MTIATKSTSKLPHTPLIQDAISIAKKKHGGKMRRISDEPYVNHPMRVAELIAAVSNDETTIAAAVVHDVLEDEDTEMGNTINYEYLELKLGKPIAEIVRILSDDKTIQNRSERKEASYQVLEQAPKIALLIKAADIIDNTNDLVHIQQSGKTIPWDVFHYSPADKINRWEKYANLIALNYPNCPLLTQLKNNISVLQNSLRR